MRILNNSKESGATVFFLMAISAVLLMFNPSDLAIYTADFFGIKFCWHILTHMLGHANFAHFLGNYFIMTPYALRLESRIGQKNFLLFFFLTGLGALTLQMLSMGQMLGGMIGSSGAAFGVIAGACVGPDDSRVRRFGLIALLLLLLISQFLSALLGFGGVAHWAHIGGAFTGILISPFFKSRKQV